MYVYCTILSTIADYPKGWRYEKNIATTESAPFAEWDTSILHCEYNSNPELTRN